MELPVSFCDEMKRILGDEYEDYLKSMGGTRKFGLRVNTAKISVEDFLKISPFELTPIPYVKNGFYYDGEKYQPAKHPYYFAGLYYLQEPSAMTPANRLPIEAGDRVLDVCAAPGGKSIHLAKAKGGTTKVLSRDISWEKLELIEENRVRCHADNMQIEQWDACVPDEKRKETADYVLADVPCSGLGILSRKPDIKYQLTQERLTELVSLQREILVNAAKLVKPGGVLVYSTCTINPEENEENIRYLLTQMPFELESLAPFIKEEIEGNDPSSGMLKLLPGQNQCDGFFVARLRRK